LSIKNRPTTKISTTTLQQKIFPLLVVPNLFVEKNEDMSIRVIQKNKLLIFYGAPSHLLPPHEKTLYLKFYEN